MKITRLALLSPPKFPSYEQTQKAILLHYMLLIAIAGSMVIGIINYQNGWYRETTYLFAFMSISVISLLLNRTQYSWFAGLILNVSLLAVICLMLYNGIGLYDETVLALPFFIIFTTFLFGKRGLWVGTFLSVGAVIAIYYLQVYGLFENTYMASPTRVLILSSLLVASGLTIWAVRDSWEMNLRNLRESYDLTLQGWARALEYRDGETAGHTQRLIGLCEALAQKLGLSQDEVRALKRGAYLHDIGKMAIPDHILLKPGPLDDEEWAVMKQHPARSREFIAEIPFLQTAIPVAYSHHERWDGNGYPDGLQGEQIPLSARIFSVLDHWDALNSDRPYRKAWPREEVLAYLQENSGTIFDSKVVEAFLSIISQEMA
jgi:hypothetical protein